MRHFTPQPYGRRGIVVACIRPSVHPFVRMTTLVRVITRKIVSNLFETWLGRSWGEYLGQVR